MPIKSPESYNMNLLLTYLLQESLHNWPHTPVEFTDVPPTASTTLCNVVYTSFDSENSNEQPEDRINNRLLEGNSG